MKISHKIIISGFLIFLAYLVVRLIIWQYEEYNERRDYCTAEGKFLTVDEKLKNIRVNFIVYYLKDWSKHYAGHKFSTIGISKYDLSDEEKIIDLMTQADFNKSWIENLGVIATGSIPEYINRRSCLRKNHPRGCHDDIGKSYNGLMTLWNDDNSINIEYLKKLPQNYSMIMDGGYIYSLSTLQKIDEKHYQMSSYSIDQRCCDQESIKRRMPFVGSNLTSDPEKYTAYRRGEIGITPEPELRLDQIDGEIIDDFYVSDLYADALLDQPQQVQKYGLLWSAGGLRDWQPSMRKLKVTACGNIVEVK
ncbi:MAG: hypothetical protein E6Q26_07035 [Acinetobacter sp.]|nr:MAG: hypothetical protein E6Q26_07035 [Acinetobacter sp.]